MATDAPAVVEGHDLVKRYESGENTLEALKGVDVGVEAGEFIAIVGPLGSGKSTLLNLLGLLDEPTGNLDRETGGTILAEFERITDEGVGVVAVTHDPQVADFADRTVQIVDGRLEK